MNIDHYWNEDDLIDLIPPPEHFEAKTRAILDQGGLDLYTAWAEAGYPWPFHYTTIYTTPQT